MPPRAFISHSSSDRAFVETELVPLLNTYGVDTWHFEDDILVATEWEKSIRAGLEQCDWFVVVVSDRACTSEWVRAEVAWAIEARPGKFVPILLETCDSTALNLRLITLQHVDYRTRSPQARKRLLQVWGAEPQEPPTVPRLQSPGIPSCPSPGNLQAQEQRVHREFQGIPFLLSLLCPGLGHVVRRSHAKGLALFVATLALLVGGLRSPAVEEILEPVLAGAVVTTTSQFSWAGSVCILMGLLLCLHGAIDASGVLHPDEATAPRQAALSVSVPGLGQLVYGGWAQGLVFLSVTSILYVGGLLAWKMHLWTVPANTRPTWLPSIGQVLVGLGALVHASSVIDAWNHASSRRSCRDIDTPSLLSLVVPGLGQVLKGHVTQGAVFFGAIVLLYTASGLLQRPYSQSSLWAALILHLVCVIDASASPGHRPVQPPIES